MDEISTYEHVAPVFGLTWSSDGSQLFSFSGDGTIQSWRNAKIEIVRKPLTGEEGSPAVNDRVEAIDWSATEFGLVTSERAGIVSYGPIPAVAAHPVIIGPGISAVELECSPASERVALREMVISDDGKRVRPRLRLRKLGSLSEPPDLESFVFEDTNIFTYDIAWSPNGTIAVLAGGETLLWLSGRFDLPRRGLNPGPWANAISWLNDDVLVVAYGDGNVRLFDRDQFAAGMNAPTEKSRVLLEVHEAAVTSISVGMAGEQFATADIGGRICIWNKSNRLIGTKAVDMADITGGLKVCVNPCLPILAYARGSKVCLAPLKEESLFEPAIVKRTKTPPSSLDNILNVSDVRPQHLPTADTVANVWRIERDRRTEDEALLLTKGLRRIARSTQKINQMLSDTVRNIFAQPTLGEAIALEDIELKANRTRDIAVTRRMLCRLVEEATTEQDIRRRSLAIYANVLFWITTPNDNVATGDQERLIQRINGLTDTDLRRQLKALASARPVAPGDIADILEQATVAIGDGLEKAKALPSQMVQTAGNQQPTTQGFALVMKGGGLKGLACIGALRELQPFYNFDLYVGTSAGAIIAALLGAGYTAAEMEDILRDVNFSEFLSERFKTVTNLIFYGGLFRGIELTNWVDVLLAKKLKSPTRVRFGQLPYHVRIYACRRDIDALIFDSKQMPDMYVSYAVRCSVAIPLFFTPEREQGLHVFDGGMRHNYPVKKLLAQTPDKDFIGLYLGDPIYTPTAKPSVIGDLINISFEATDVEALREYSQKTVVIDPKPISTLDFSLSSEEKTYLVSQGRAAALQFLEAGGRVNKALVDQAKNLATNHKGAALKARQKRTRRSKIIFRSLLVLALILFLVWKFGAFGLWQFAADNIHVAGCRFLTSCSKPKVGWVAMDNPASVSHAITQDTPFAFPDLPPTPATGPVVGSQRYGKAKASCAPLLQNAWKLHNGEIVLDDDDLIQNGWVSPSYVGEPEPPDWNKFDNLAKARFGFTPGFANNNRCSHGNHCKLSPDEIKAHSTVVQVPVDECSRMRMAEENAPPNRTSLTVWVRGNAKHQSIWTVTAPIEKYKEQTPDE
jgi:predicted acylesterase/phospholipase RssA